MGATAMSASVAAPSLEDGLLHHVLLCLIWHVERLASKAALRPCWQRSGRRIPDDSRSKVRCALCETHIMPRAGENTCRADCRS